jgi:hypothetical protein
VTDKLPGILQEIADLVGPADAVQIAHRYGGTRVYFPAKAKDSESHWLIMCVGKASADKLCDHFAVDGRGQRIEIPLYVGGTYRQLTRAIAERVHKLDQEGASSTEIVRQVGVTQRSVHRHRARHRGKKDSKQGRLF